MSCLPELVDPLKNFLKNGEQVDPPKVKKTTKTMSNKRTFKKSKNTMCNKFPPQTQTHTQACGGGGGGGGGGGCGGGGSGGGRGGGDGGEGVSRVCTNKNRQKMDLKTQSHLRR